MQSYKQPFSEKIYVEFGKAGRKPEHLLPGYIYEDSNEARLITAEQIHRDQIAQAGIEYLKSSRSITVIPGVDALITSIPGLFLVIRTADCAPILFYDPVNQVVAAVHAGREGIRLDICRRTIEKLQLYYHSDPQDLYTWIGPCICPAHYPVDQATFNDFVTFTSISQKYPHLDLRYTVSRQLMNTGVRKDKIFHENKCTYADNDYYSFRRDHTHLRQYNIIGLI